VCFLLAQADLVFARRSARDIAFGWTDPLLAALARLDPSKTSGAVDPFVRGLTGRSTARQTAADAAAAGPSRVRTRADTSHPASFAGELLTWRGDTVSRCCASPRGCPPDAASVPWHPPAAAAVRGADASTPRFPPRLPPGAAVRAWSAEGLRSVSLANADAETADVAGAACLRFRLDMSQFAPAPGAPDGASYDLWGAPGLTSNMSGCTAGVPLSASAPHFLYVDDVAVRQGVTGLDPDPQAHDTFVVRAPTRRADVPARVCCAACHRATHIASIDAWLRTQMLFSSAGRMWSR
jgi:hypothetical protein